MHPHGEKQILGNRASHTNMHTRTTTTPPKEAADPAEELRPPRCLLELRDIVPGLSLLLYSPQEAHHLHILRAREP
jgi:hypothetical protein